MQRVSIYEENSEQLHLEEFVKKHQSLVKKIAAYMKRKLPSHIDFDDLLQSGLVGLLEARETFQEDQGASFETYASFRIRGSMIDSMRKNSWVTRDTMKSMKAISAAITKIEQRTQKPASSEEIAKELGLSLDEHARICQEISLSQFLSLHDIEQTHTILEEDESNPSHEIEQENLKQNLNIVLKDLPEREQLVLSLYYIEEFNFKEIGEILEVSEARVCQLHTQAIARVKNSLELNAVSSFK